MILQELIVFDVIFEGTEVDQPHLTNLYPLQYAKTQEST